VYLAVFTLALVAAYSLAFSVFMSDFCQEPVTWTQAMAAVNQKTFSDTNSQRALTWYLKCPDGGDFNPLNSIIKPMNDVLTNVTQSVNALIYYANTQDRNLKLHTDVLQLQANVNTLVNVTGQSFAVSQSCKAVHNDLFTAYNASCGPYLAYSTELSIILFFMTCALVLIRPLWNLVRFYRSHELRARRFMLQIKNTDSALGFDATGPGAPPSAATVALVRPSLSHAANSKRRA
jgi:hypothetical protein